MGDSAMVIMWPSRDAEDGTYGSVTLSQRKAPFETMPLPDPDPPFVAALELATTSVCVLLTSRAVLCFDDYFLMPL
jgi:hypothetical protein